jgi:hypothetical protein
MALSGISLNAVTVTGAGSALMFDEPKASHTMFVLTTGSPSTVTVFLEGTPDGVNWFEISSITNTSLLNIGANWPLAGVRANLTVLSGGSSPTVTAWFASA